MEKNMGVFLLCFLLLGLVAQQSLITPVACRSLVGFTDQKNFYQPKHSDVKPDCDCPTPAHGGGTPTPSKGGSGSHGTPTPSHGGGHSSPPAIVIPPPSSPAIKPPVVPAPTTPSIPTPSPVIPDPNCPPFSPGTCYYWSTHPEAIGAIFGYWGTIGESFGAACSAAFGKNMSLPDALKNTRTDGIGALYREGTAALLNSIACKTYSFTPEQVKDAFATAIATDKTAEAQAEIFKQANEGRSKN